MPDNTINSELDQLIKQFGGVFVEPIAKTALKQWAAQEANKARLSYRDEVLALIDKNKVRDGEAQHVIGAELLAHEIKQLTAENKD